MPRRTLIVTLSRLSLSLRAGLRERLELLVHGVDEAPLVPVLLVEHPREHVPVLRLFEFVEQQQGVLRLDAHVLGARVAVVGEVGGPVPRDKQVQDLPEVGEAGEQNALLEN